MNTKTALLLGGFGLLTYFLSRKQEPVAGLLSSPVESPTTGIVGEYRDHPVTAEMIASSTETHTEGINIAGLNEAIVYLGEWAGSQFQHSWQGIPYQVFNPIFTQALGPDWSAHYNLSRLMEQVRSYWSAKWD